MLLALVIISGVVASWLFGKYMVFLSKEDVLKCPECSTDYTIIDGWCRTCGYKDEKNFYMAHKFMHFSFLAVGIFGLLFGYWSWDRFVDSFWLTLSVIAYGIGGLFSFTFVGIFTNTEDKKIEETKKSFDPKKHQKEMKKKAAQRKIDSKEADEILAKFKATNEPEPGFASAYRSKNSKPKEPVYGFDERDSKTSGNDMFVDNEIEHSVTFADACLIAIQEVNRQLDDPDTTSDTGLLKMLKYVLAKNIDTPNYFLDQPVVGPTGQNQGFTKFYNILQEIGVSFNTSGLSDSTIAFSFKKI